MNTDYFLRKYLQARPLFLSLIRAKEAELFQKYMPFKRPILDFGIGDGFFAKAAFNGERIDVGIDLEESRINEAEKTGIYRKLVTYDGMKIPFPSRTFATVTSNCVLEHIPDLKYTLGEIYRVLKPRGRFLTTVMAKSWEDNLFMTRLVGNRYKDWMRKKQIHENLLSSSEWSASFREAGFRIKSVTGYLSPSACRLIDICHYLSVPSLVSYKLTGKWVLFPFLTKILPLSWLNSIISKDIRVSNAGALFYELNK